VTFDNKIHHRKSIRLANYDYSQAGAYFITICTQNRECLFGEIVDDEMQFNDAGRIIQIMWNEIPIHFPLVELDEYVVMPNHFHGLFSIRPSELSAGRKLAPAFSTLAPSMAVASSAPTEFSCVAPAVGQILRRFKSMSAIAVNKSLGRSSQALWQRNYWERVVRNEKELHGMQEYIVNNPRQWELDKLHPKNKT
jgi:putative transposase